MRSCLVACGDQLLNRILRPEVLADAIEKVKVNDMRR